MALFDAVGTVRGAAGTAAAPVTNTAVATLAAASLPAGTYQLQLVYTIFGAVETAGINWRLKAGTTTITDLPTGGLGVPTQVDIPAVKLDGATALTLGTGGSGAAASTVYNCAIIATQIG